ncbi:hypothetical protein ACKKBF_B40195 [Auxenochlorella protothecoides x Auxenochlorella symbiontica]
MVNDKETDFYCRLKGYNGGGIVMQSLDLKNDGPFKDFTIGTVNPASFTTCTPSATVVCKAIALVQCLPNGVPGCVEDQDHNIGTGNTGKNNIGDNNVGDRNHGNHNIGSDNIGTGLTGQRMLCNFAKTDRCPLLWLATNETIKLFAPPPPPTPHPPPPPPSPPPPPKQTCDPRTSFFGLPTIKYQNTTYLTSSSNVDTYCRLQGFAGVGAVREERIFKSTPFPQFTIEALDPHTRETCTPANDAPCRVIAVVECLPEGIPRCQPDDNGNIGNRNIGMNNLGHNNHGDNNSGNLNHGSHVTGSENWGNYLICNGIQTGSQNECTIDSLVTSETLILDE